MCKFDLYEKNIYIEIFRHLQNKHNRIGGVMVSMLASRAVDCVLEQYDYLEISESGIYNFFFTFLKELNEVF
jgi:hypothetical protein